MLLLRLCRANKLWFKFELQWQFGRALLLWDIKEHIFRNHYWCCWQWSLLFAGGSDISQQLFIVSPCGFVMMFLFFLYGTNKFPAPCLSDSMNLYSVLLIIRPRCLELKISFSPPVFLPSKQMISKRCTSFCWQHMELHYWKHQNYLKTSFQNTYISVRKLLNLIHLIQCFVLHVTVIVNVGQLQLTEI